MTEPEPAWSSAALARAITAMRIERGMKRKDLVAACPISMAYLCEIENAKKNPSIPMVVSLARALGTTTEQVFLRAHAIRMDPRNGLAVVSGNV